MNNLVMGAVTNYSYYEIEPWLVSLKKTDYKGDIALACFNINKQTIDKLKSQGVICIVMGADLYGNAAYPKPGPWNICVERFLVYSKFLEKHNYKNVLLTDVKDVIFQSDPFATIDYCQNSIICSYEHIRYKDEPWGENNFRRSFGNDEYERIKNNIIINAGVIAGAGHLLRELCSQIYQICLGKPSQIPGGGGPDQATLNFLLGQRVWFNYVHNTFDTWACQAGTTKDPNKIQNFAPLLDLNTLPYMKDDIIYNGVNIKYPIVHQYDRVPEWKEMVERKYRVTS